MKEDSIKVGGLDIDWKVSWLKCCCIVGLTWIYSFSRSINCFVVMGMFNISEARENTSEYNSDGRRWSQKKYLLQSLVEDKDDEDVVEKNTRFGSKNELVLLHKSNFLSSISWHNNDMRVCKDKEMS